LYFEFLNDGKKVLDLGCGDARDLITLQICCGFKNLPFTENTFDVIVSKYAMQTEWNIDSIYREVSRVLKKMVISYLLLPIQSLNLLGKRIKMEKIILNKNQYIVHSLIIK
jgi:ubiquinone/menaquinone biosynthesis C-methylase UbiE